MFFSWNFPLLSLVSFSLFCDFEIRTRDFANSQLQQGLFNVQGTCSAVSTTCSSYTENIMQLIPSCHILSASGTQQTENSLLFLFSSFLDDKCGDKS